MAAQHLPWDLDGLAVDWNNCSFGEEEKGKFILLKLNLTTFTNSEYTHFYLSVH